MPAPAELGRFFSELDSRRERLLRLVDAENTERSGLITELTELSEQLLIAEEELRVQQEELDDTRGKLDTLAAERERLLRSSSAAYVFTDERGAVLATNDAADQLLLRPLRIAPRPFGTWFDVSDRAKIRSAFSRARDGRGAQLAPDVALRRADGTALRVTVVVTNETEPGSTSTLLRCELRTDPMPPAELHAVPDENERTEAPARLADVIGELAELQTVDEIGSAALPAVVRIVPGAAWAALVLRRNRKSCVAAETDVVAGQCAMTAIELGEGPGVSVTGGTSLLRIDDTVDDTMWGRYADRVVDLGVRSVLAAGLAVTPNSTGALIVYSPVPRAFDARSESVLSTLAMCLGAAIGRATVADNLRQAVESRQVIGVAIGILMARHQLTSQAAFGMLIRASQQHNVKLRDIARALAETGQPPPGIMLR